MGTKGLIAACVLLAVGGCQATSGSFCAVMTLEDGTPLLKPTEADVAAVSDRLAAGLVTILETAEKECGLRPPNR